MAFQRSLLEARAVRPLPTLPRKRGRVGRGRWRPIAIAAALVTAIGFAGCSGTLNSVDLPRNTATAAGVMASESNPNRGTGDFKVGLVLPLSASRSEEHTSELQSPCNL